MTETAPVLAEDAAVRRRRTVLLAVLLAVLTVAAYAPSIGGGFIWDDDDYVTKNPVLRSFDGLKSAWVPGVTPQFYPVVFTTFWIEFQLWGLDPAGYHAVNVLLHLLNALLLWRLAALLRIPGAYVLALLFALHPVHVESVAWITERKNVLSLALYLLAALAYLRFDRLRLMPREVRGKRDQPWTMYIAVLLVFSAALLSKSVTASLPVAIVLMMLWRGDRLSVSRLWPLAPMLLMGAIAGLHTGYLEQTRVGAVGPDFEFSFLERILIASHAILFYPWKLALPWPLMFTYPRWEIGTDMLSSWLPLLVCVVLASGVVWLWVKGWRGTVLGIVFYAVTIFPALGFANIYPMRFSFVADHFAYHASIGLLAVAAGGLSRLITVAAIRLGMVGLLVVVYSAITFQQGYMYTDEETLWEWTIARNPDAWMAHNNLSRIHLASGDPARAEHHARESLDRKPDHFTAMINLSEALRMQGHLTEAEQQAAAAAEELRSLAELHAEAGREQHARRLLPIQSEAWFLQGRLAELQERPDDAVVAYERSVTLAEESDRLSFERIESLERLAYIALVRGDASRAERVYRDLLSLVPNHVGAMIDLGEIERRAGNFAVSRRLLERAVEVAEAMRDERLPLAAYRLAWLLGTCPEREVRDPEIAIFIGREIVRRTHRTNPSFLDVLAIAYAADGQFDTALPIAEEALALAEELAFADLAEAVQERIVLFRQARPYVDDP